MKKKLLYLPFLFLVLSSSLLGQVNSNGLVPYSEKDLWGYMNRDKETVIAPSFDKASFFDFYIEDLPWAIVRKDSKYGAINQEGSIQIPIAFDSIVREAIHTTAGRLIEVYQDNTKLYLTEAGELIEQMIGERKLLYSCNGPLTFNCRTYIKTDDFEQNKQADTLNYSYVEPHFGREGGLKIKDTINVQLDSIVVVAPSEVNILYRNDGKINICRSISKDNADALCLGFKYDEVVYLDCLDKPAYKTYGLIIKIADDRQLQTVFKVRQGDYWGIIDLTAMESNRFSSKYKQSWEFIPPKYRMIQQAKYRYYYVEHAEGQFGYIMPLGRGQVREYWHD